MTPNPMNMGSKRSKLTAGRARERISTLEESLKVRVNRLEQLEARLERSSEPEERLISAKQRLERRIELETGQLEKLRKLLSGTEHRSPEASDEFDDLHQSFEEVRSNVAQIQARLEVAELPRDLPLRLTSFEERIARREEADSDLFGQVLTLQTALDQERQTVRKLNRRVREQDQSIEALREAIEDSVVATVDLAERMEELEELLSEREDSGKKRHTTATDQKNSRLLVALQARIASLEGQHRSQTASTPGLESNSEKESYSDILERLSALEKKTAQVHLGLDSQPRNDQKFANAKIAVFGGIKIPPSTPAQFSGSRLR